VYLETDPVALQTELYYGLQPTIDAYAAGTVDPRPLIAATVGLDDLPAVLSGERPVGSGHGPKFQVAIS